jgi:DNA-binding CsgD family transcriptional regulator
MNIESLFEQPAVRRYWLLSKALESAPIDQALEVARAAEEFLTGAAPSFSLPNRQGTDRPNLTAATSAPQMNVTIPKSQRGWEDPLSEPTWPTIISDDGGHLFDSAAGTVRPSTASGLADQPADGTTTNADDPPDGEVLLALAGTGLTTLASTERPLQIPGTPETVATLPGYRSGGRNLSPRETDMLRGLSYGNSNRLIARDLGITEDKVKVHLKSLMRKIAVANRTQAALWAHNNGFAATVSS